MQARPVNGHMLHPVDLLSVDLPQNRSDLSLCDGFVGNLFYRARHSYARSLVKLPAFSSTVIWRRRASARARTFESVDGDDWALQATGHEPEQGDGEQDRGSDSHVSMPLGISKAGHYRSGMEYLIGIISGTKRKIPRRKRAWNPTIRKNERWAPGRNLFTRVPS